MQQQIQEKPLYILKKKVSRSLIPKILSLLILGIIFYLGILLNLSLLELDGETETIVKMTSLIIVLLIIIIGIVLSYRHAHQPYKFYHANIVQNKKSLPYVKIANTEEKQNFIDKLFKTYHIDLTDKFSLKHIPQKTDIKNYVDQMIIYAKKNQTTPLQ